MTTAQRLLSVSLLLAVSVGCDEIEQFTPDVRFDRFDVEDINFQGASVDFVFQVDNPNPVELGLKSFSYNFGMEQVPLFGGDNEDGFQLLALESSPLVLPVSLNWVDTWDAVSATRGLDTIGFGLDGHMGFGIPLERFEGEEIRVPYDEGGEFPALRTPKFQLGKIKVKRLDLLSQSADLELEFDIDNDHASTLFFDRFDYKVNLAGNQVGTGLIGSLGQVDGAKVDTFILPLDVDLFALGDAGWQAIVNRRPLNANLSADMDVDTPFGLVPLQINERADLAVE
ncbi:MAG: LEA type 2 family protein [Proteobacteria bacterium]|nr:LEA type 2 family protein [Pseudomonadota bacterium]